MTFDEQVLLTGVARLSSARSLPRPVVLRLTSSRLVTLTHRAFGADQVLELPRSTVRNIVLDDDVLAVTWRSAASASSVLTLQPWTGRTRVGSPLRHMAAVAQQLDQWLAANWPARHPWKVRRRYRTVSQDEPSTVTPRCGSRAKRLGRNGIPIRDRSIRCGYSLR